MAPGRRRKTPFVRPPKKGASVFSYIWYVIKVFLASVFGILSLPLTYIGFLSGIFVWLLIFALAAGALAYTKVYPDLKHCREVAYDTIVKMQDSDFRKLSDTIIYDKDNQTAGTVNAGHYQYVDITKISPNIQNAYIDQEDRRFKTHPGYDWMAIARAGIALVRHNGKVTQGASTITQQVIKNTYLTQEKTFTRKITEIMLAPELEKKYGKDKIMEFYCNGNFYGHHCYGVQAASRYYFGKDAKDVEPWEAALLAGISNSPTAYDPVRNPAAAKEKRNEVLSSMKDCGTITEEEKKAYQAKPLDIVQEYAEGTSENYITSYAIHCAAQELMKNDGFQFQYTFASEDEYEAYQSSYQTAYANKSEEIRSGGYRIYTTLDPAVQNAAQAHLDQDLKKFTEVQDNGKFALQGAAVIVDNSTGYVVAVVGGRGTEDEFNRAYLAVRQPGSTIKPLLDYAPAFETGEYYPSKIIDDHEWEDGPQNSGGNYYGPITIREGLNRSLNTVAWQVLQGIGRTNGLSYLGRMHFQTITYTDSQADAIAIGGFTNGVRAVDMAKGYETLANSGVHDNHTCIRSIKTDKSDDELYTEDNKTDQVFTADTAYMITDVLKGTMDKEYGTGYGLDLTGQQAAGKTGTTNSNKDTWFCGYTRYFTTSVWVGYDTPRAMPGVFGATYAGSIWHDIMTDLHKNLPESDWERPITVTEASYNPETGERTDQNTAKQTDTENVKKTDTESGKNTDTENAKKTDSNTGKKTNSEDEDMTDSDTGFKDLFSSNADTQAAEAQHQHEQQNLTDDATEALTAFEAYQINSVEDTYSVDKTFQSIMAKISVIEEDSVRKELSNRAVIKDTALKKIIDGMSDEIKAYESVRAEKASRAAESAAAEAASRRSSEATQIKVDSFRSRISAIRGLNYQSENAQSLFGDAENALSELNGYDGYDNLLEELNNAMSYYQSLPSKSVYDAQQASKSAADAASKASSESQNAAKGSNTSESISGNLHPSTTANEQYGPGFVKPSTAPTVPSTTAKEAGPGV